MILDDALRDLAAAGSELPRAAMRWSLDHWDETRPVFITLLDAYGRGLDRSEGTGRALFFIVHLLGEKGEAAAFGPLCRLLLDGEASEMILGDGITTTVPRVLVSTYGGDLAALATVVEAVEADDFARYGALLVMAYLARTGRVPEAEMHAHLLRWLAEMQPQAEHLVWMAWVLAVAHLGYADLARTAEELIRRGFVPGGVMDAAGFREDLERALGDPETVEGFAHDCIGPFGEALEELGSWHSFSGEDEPGFTAHEARQPVTNPLRGVGRNDPCPCGSGKKFKKCCLGAAVH